jgi:hypothetical protein
MIIISFDIGIRNLAYCILKTNNTDHSICEWKKVDLGISNKDMQGLSDSLIEVLDNIYYNEIPNVNEEINEKIVVLIEQQMTSVMRNLQIVINTYFKIIARYKSQDINTIFVSPKLKLKIVSKYPDYVENDKNVSSKYKQNKINSVHFCTWLLTKMKFINELDILQKEKKADDLSDVYLQALAWYSAYKSI